MLPRKPKSRDVKIQIRSSQFGLVEVDKLRCELSGVSINAMNYVKLCTQVVDIILSNSSLITLWTGKINKKVE